MYDIATICVWALLKNGDLGEKMEEEEWKWWHGKYSFSWHFFSSLVFTPPQWMLTWLTVPWTMYRHFWASLVAQLVKNLPVMQETWVRSLGWEDPLEEGMATHSSILAWRIPWTGEPGGLQSMGSQRVGHDWLSTAWFALSLYILYFTARLIMLHFHNDLH